MYPETRDCGRSSDRARRRGVLIGQRLETPGASHAVDVTLREHGAQPRAQTAAAVKVLEQRPPLAAALDEAEQLAVQRVGQFARTAGGIDSVGRSIEHRTMLADEVLPRAFVPTRAGAGEREILQM